MIRCHVDTTLPRRGCGPEGPGSCRRERRFPASLLTAAGRPRAFPVVEIRHSAWRPPYRGRFLDSLSMKLLPDYAFDVRRNVAARRQPTRPSPELVNAGRRRIKPEFRPPLLAAGSAMLGISSISVDATLGRR